MFLDSPTGKARDAIHVLFAGEKVSPEYLLPAPDVNEADSAGPGRDHDDGLERVGEATQIAALPFSQCEIV